MEKQNAVLSVSPAVSMEGAVLLVRGSGWPDCPIALELDGRRVVIDEVPAGSRVKGGVRPAPNGEFAVRLWTRDWKPGDRELVATSDHAALRPVVAKLTIAPRLDLAGAEDEGDDEDGAADGGPEPAGMDYQRRKWFSDVFLGGVREIEPGTVVQQIREVRGLRQQPKLGGLGHATPLSIIIEGECNWTPVFSAPAVVGLEAGHSGRVNAIALHPTASGTAYIGTSSGGVWKTTDSGATWQPKSDYQGSLRISSVAIDPNNALRVFAGTGDGGYPGVGLLHSETGGDTWTEEGAATLAGSNIYRIRFDPADTANHMFVATSHGVYELTTSGGMWTQLRAGNATDCVVVPVSGGGLAVVAAFGGEGIYRATKSGGVWSAWTKSMDADLPATYGRTLLAQCAGTPARLYAVVVQTTRDGLQGLFRSNDGGGSWARMDARLDERYEAQDITGLGHTHSLADPPTADFVAAPASHTYTTASGGSPAHTHTITLTVAQVRQLAAGAQLEVLTNADATGHQHNFIFYSVAQAHYNLFLEAHPTNPDVLCLGVSFVYRNTSGGGVFTKIAGGGTGEFHIDQHAFAFDPTAPDLKLWAGNDGGVFRSGNNGATWKSRNNGLQTLEYFCGDVHPQWENIMLAGAQDNGVQRFTGNPAALEVHGWDIPTAVIDPGTPTRMYIARQNQNGVMRSLTAGAPGSWVNTAPVLLGTAQLGNPFVLDPSNPSVCYFGNTILWRSPDHTDTWVPLTAQFSDNIRAIAVHPTNPDTVYFAAGNHVYRIVHGAGPWLIPNVTLTDLGGPMGNTLSASALAVESSGAVWMTTAVNVSGAGIPHAYRWDGTSWAPRSTGLPPSVPLQAILIDPTTPMNLFCGGLIGVYRSIDGGMNWTDYSAGIPNVPISVLKIGPGRLIRAITYGRGVWEREIDPLFPCPNIDIYVRDNVIDSGRHLPSPEGVPHPLDPARNVYHWQSPDIKVDALEGSPETFQTMNAITDAVGFASITHRNPRRNHTNRFYAQVHNRGYDAANDVIVRAFFADAHMGLPDLPADFFTMGHPFVGTPSGTAWTAVGPAQTFPKIYPGQPVVAEWDFFVPAGANEHSCLLILVTSAASPLDGTGFTSPDALVRQRKQVALKNLHVVDIPAMSTDPDDAVLIEVGGVTGEGLSSIVLNWATLPPGSEIVMAFELVDDRHPVLASDKDLEHAGIKAVDAAKRFKETLPTRCGRDRKFDVGRAYAMQRGNHASTTLPHVALPAGRSVGVQLALRLRESGDEETAHTFDVIQMVGRHIVGGSTYEIRPEKERNVPGACATPEDGRTPRPPSGATAPRPGDAT